MVWILFILVWLLIGLTTMLSVKLFYKDENGFVPRLGEIPILLLFVVIWPIVWYFEIKDGV